MCISAVLASLFFAGCTPELSIQAVSSDGIQLSFQTGFSANAEKTLRALASSVSGSESDSSVPVISASDMQMILEDAGFTNITAKNASPTAISTTADYLATKQGELSKTDFVTRGEHSLTLTFGPRQFKSLYALSNEESQMYFDLLMIPALEDETLSVAEYNALLASLYGKSFADEITSGKLSVTLSSPDGKKRTNVSLSLGELLTLAEEKSWSVTW